MLAVSAAAFRITEKSEPWAARNETEEVEPVRSRPACPTVMSRRNSWRAGVPGRAYRRGPGGFQPWAAICWSTAGSRLMSSMVQKPSSAAPRCSTWSRTQVVA